MQTVSFAFHFVPMPFGKASIYLFSHRYEWTAGQNGLSSPVSEQTVLEGKTLNSKSRRIRLGIPPIKTCYRSYRIPRLHKESNRSQGFLHHIQQHTVAQADLAICAMIKYTQNQWQTFSWLFPCSITDGYRNIRKQVLITSCSSRDSQVFDIQLGLFLLQGKWHIFWVNSVSVLTTASLSLLNISSSNPGFRKTILNSKRSQNRGSQLPSL